jgi:DNA-directed RNA polymerase subunit M/transcription elongation factor TFIIS
MTQIRASLWPLSTHSESSSSQFCPTCHSLLLLPDSSLICRCCLCHYSVQFSADDARLEKISLSTKFNCQSLNVNDAADEAFNSTNPADSFKRATVNECCPQCNHNELSFYTMQMRSVDAFSQYIYYRSY